MTVHAPLTAAAGPGIARPGVTQVPAPPAAAVTTDEVRQLIYDREESWGWVVEFEAAPDGIAAIYEDGQGDIWRIPVTVGADDNITLGEAVPVRMVFVQTTDDGRAAPLAASLAAQGSRRTIARFAPADPTAVRATRTGTDARLTVTQTVPDIEEPSMDLTALREAYGLADDMTDDDVLAHVTAQAPTGEPDSGLETEPAGEPPAADPEPAAPAEEPAAATVTVTAQRFAEMEQQITELSARDADRTAAEQRAHRDQVIAGALTSGRISPAERQHWRDALDEAPAATEQLIATLQPGRRVPTSEVGAAGGTADDADARYAQLTADAPSYKS